MKQDRWWRKHVSLVARLIVAVVAVAWVFRDQDIRQLGQLLRRVDPGVFVLALALYFASQVGLAFRWRLLLGTQGVRLPALAAVRLHLVGLFFNNLMPSSVGGDFVRAWYVTKHTEHRTAAALSVFVDRIVGLLGLVLMAAFSYLALRRAVGSSLFAGSGDESLSPDGSGGSVWLVLAGIGLVALALQGVHPGLRRWWRRILGPRLKPAWEKGSLALRLYLRRPWTILAALLGTVVLQSVTIVAFWLLGRNVGVAAPLKHYFVVFPVTWVVAALPVSVAGAGVLEGGVRLLFVSLSGVSAESAVALAICQRATWVLSSLPGAIIHLGGGHLPGTRRKAPVGEGGSAVGADT